MKNLRFQNVSVSGIAIVIRFYTCFLIFSHCDLKPEKILLDSAENSKIADFGIAIIQKNELLQTSCGSPHYASPEVIRGESYEGNAADIWSCGVILFTLLCGFLPFNDSNIKLVLAKVKLGIFSIPSHVSAQARDLIQKILIRNPNERLTVLENNSSFHKYSIILG